jgi:hypothetical protein
VRNNKLLNYSISNNGEMILLIYNSKYQIVKEGDYFKEYEKTPEFINYCKNTKVFETLDNLNKNIFLIDKNYNIHFLTKDVYEKVGWFPHNCIFSSNNKLLFIERDEVYTFDISNINKGKYMIVDFISDKTKKNSINNFFNNSAFDKNLLDVIQQY